ncbi:TPA: hypothetical protein N3N58_004837 [Klebsiella pneumoniae]|uniref:O-antigen and lipid-linked capsular repeat unit polymerase n=1 Tax=Klebsiella sp. 8588 TaxID=1497815 RepID=A0A0P0YRI0_9ENTR|nr:hypothetical protein [Klebsiella pneumoniae]BAT23736.1 hypothetical protein [Klebsiella sp. 8588]MCD1430062.1 hypothetical protein [Klebsiella pneumoniae]MCD1435381.1 hypothetical protein [Klebsiella pneumoniae]MCP5755730.1 hypothetical protein [Klebsiella pneumoniae]MCP6268648.1 hypothetical protein [Klebsiella pneumoniae]
MLFISPFFGVLFGYFIFIISFLIPSSLFHNLVGENNYGFLSIESLFFVTFCVLSFVIGLHSYNMIPRKKTVYIDKPYRVTSPKAMIFLLLLLNITMFFIVYLIVRNNAGLISAVLYYSGGVKSLKSEMDLSGTYASVSSAIYGLSTWCLYVYFKLRDTLAKWNRRFILFLIIILYALLIFKTLLLLARFELMPLLVSFIVVYLWSKYNEGKSAKVFIMLIVFFISIVTIFYIISKLRNTEGNSYDSWVSFFGYIFVPYSHLGALLSGQLKYLDPGFGYYAVNFLNSLPVIGDYMTRSFFSWPDSYIVWQREFQDTWQAGLNGDLIWITAFGYLWVSLKLATPLYMFINGILVQAAWNGFKKGKLLGIIFYPWCFFCVLFWFGMNMISFRTTLYLMISAIFIYFFSFLQKKITY